MHLFGILEAKETPVLRQICKVLWWTWASLQQSLANLAPQDKTEQVEETKRKRKSLWEPWFFFESCRRRVGYDCVKQLFWAEWNKNETSQNAILDNSSDFWFYIVNHSHIVLRQVMLIFLSLAHVLHDVNWWLGQFPSEACKVLQRQLCGTFQLFFHGAGHCWQQRGVGKLQGTWQFL